MALAQGMPPSLSAALNEGSPPWDWLWGHLLSPPLCLLGKNECYSQPCKNGGTCLDLDGDYACKCPSPFLGKTCHVRKSLAPTVQNSLSLRVPHCSVPRLCQCAQERSHQLVQGIWRAAVGACVLAALDASRPGPDGRSIPGKVLSPLGGGPRAALSPPDLHAVRGADGWCGFG